MHTLHSLCTIFIVWKISKIGAKILKIKYIKFDFRWGSAPEPAGELIVLARPPSWI